MIQLSEIAEKIYKDLLPQMRSRSINVFLVGANPSKVDSLRNSVRRELLRSPSPNRMRVYYPEDLFAELINVRNYNLLDLENLLARSAHVTVICLESAGAIAELGAFANHRDLSARLLVVVDEKHKRDHSFIRMGPLRKIDRRNSKGIYWYDPKANIKQTGAAVRFAVREIAKTVTIDSSLSNPLVAEDFILLFVYVLGPVKKEEIMAGLKTQRKTPENDAYRVQAVYSSALHSLFKQRWIVLSRGSYNLSPEGLDELHGRLKLTASSSLVRGLDNLTVMVLNDRLRMERRSWRRFESPAR